MIRTISLVCFALAVAACANGQRRGGPGRTGSQAFASAPVVPKSDFERRVLATIDEAFQNGDTYANVPAADGRMLRLLAESVNAKHVVEIGTSTGISGLWFSLALEKTGGKLTTFELDPGRANTARETFKKAGVDSLITIVQGDAHANVTRVAEPVDVVFIDADKEGYIDYLEKLLPRVRPGGLILAHNVDMVRDYLQKVQSDPALDTIIYSSGGGLAVTLKKR